MTARYFFWGVFFFLFSGCQSQVPVEQLMEKIKDEYSITREQAAKKLGTLGKRATKAIPALRKSLLDPHKNVRRNAAEALGKMGPLAIQATADLSKRLWDKVEQVRGKAAWALGRLGPKTLPTLKKILRGDYPHARYYTVLALRQMKEKAVPLLQFAIRDPSKKVRRAAVETLVMLGHQHIKIVLKLLSDKQENIRSFVAWKISTMASLLVKQQPKQLPLLVNALQAVLADPSSKVRMYATFAMSKLGVHAAPAMDALVKALQDQEWYVRKNAANALGAIGGRAREAIPMLVRALLDRTWDVKTEAARALRRIDEVKAVRAMLPLLRIRMWRIRKYIVQTMGWIGARASASTGSLYKLLQDPVRDVRLATMTALSQIGAPALPVLRRGFRARSSSVRILAARACGKMGRKARRLLPVLKRLVRNRDFLVRHYAARAVGKIKPLTLSQVRSLQRSLKEGSLRKQRKAVLRLGMGGVSAASAIPDLVRALQSKDRLLRQQSVISLGWLGKPTKPGVVSSLIRMFPSETNRKLKRELAISLIWLIPVLNDEAMAYVKQLQESKDKLLQRAYVLLMERMLQGSQAVFLFASSLEQLSSGVLPEALEILGRLAPPLVSKQPQTLLHARLIRPLLPFLHHRNSKVRLQATVALGNIGYKAIGAVPALRKTLRDRSRLVRRAVAATMGWIGSKAYKAIPDLQRVLKDRDLVVRRNAVFALSRMAKRAVKPLTRLLLATRNPHILQSVCLALGRVWLPRKQLKRVEESLRVLLLDKKLRESVLAEARHTIRRLQSDDKPTIFWVDHPRSPTLEIYAPSLLFPHGP